MTAREGGAGPVLRIDLHMHTWGSWDSLSDPRRVLEMARSRGVERIAITDHNRLAVALELAREFPDAVIPGEEVKTAEGIDVIGLYLHSEIPKGTPAAEVCERVHEQGGLVYLPHPFARGKGGDGRYAEVLAGRLDIVEVFNGRIQDSRRNRQALDFAARHGLPQGAGTDAHTVGEVARSFVEVDDHPNRPEELLRALRSGRVVGKTAPIHVFLGSNWAKLRKRLPGAPSA